MVSSFAGNTFRATQLVNNNMLANMYAFKRTVEQTKESGNDLARACVNLGKKWRNSIKTRTIIS
jgi:ATP-dependent protease HslVU (ClpYQ) peptidase subunit